MKKPIAIILCIVMCALMFSTAAYASDEKYGTDVSNGYCGAEGRNLKWTMYDSGTLVISGTGEMADYMDFERDRSTAPWRLRFGTDIYYVVIEDGVESIGSGAFYYKDGVTTRVSIPESVKSIGNSVFYPSMIYNDQNPKESDYSYKTAVCYSGSEDEWNEILIDNSTRNALKTDKYIVCFDGTEPEPFCEIAVTSASGSGAQQYKNFTTSAIIYLGDHKDARTVWDFGEDYGVGRFLGESTSESYKQNGCWKHENYYGKPGEKTIKLSLTDPDGTVLARNEYQLRVCSATVAVRAENFARKVKTMFEQLIGGGFAVFMANVFLSTGVLAAIVGWFKTLFRH